ncbi:hypothetical protein AB1Y20_022267 [Prymnesium parvum]|uniref:Uncharacterized protein n=1 Tax=Prymnesium parvum TaxID=97485 RepID=A0AB34JGQ1_PRYPA
MRSTRSRKSAAEELPAQERAAEELPARKRRAAQSTNSPPDHEAASSLQQGVAAAASGTSAEQSAPPLQRSPTTEAQGDEAESMAGRQCTPLRPFLQDRLVAFPFALDLPKLSMRIFSCGLGISQHPLLAEEAHDHAQTCAFDQELARTLSDATEKLTHQLASWRPSHDKSSEPWQAFVVWPKVLHSLGVDLEGSDGVERATRAVLGLPEDGRHAIVTKAMPHSRKTLWHQRFYFQNGQVDAKTLAKTKAATNYFWALTAKDSCMQFKNHHPESCFYGWGVVVAGRAKKLPGGLVMLCYTDGSEEHVYHGD